ncbi:Sex peptide receptor [Frankliniella fusca]|uniref:Sex peptide receptor n=1 Tax=Frankliniella fusca TaxID=407009 RepID=A0AAE1H6P9_9NEOP|nr:Sex peptide receptor [Frankliniella fusca]
MLMIVYSVVIKLVPCAALTILSLRLIFALLETKRRRQQLSMGGSVHQALNGAAGAGGKPSSKRSRRANKSQRLVEKEKQTDRTTKMLLAVLLLFLITEAPQGLLGLLSVLLGGKFFRECYVKLGDVMDILALINSAINFMVYCCMSRQFRNTFNQLFRPRLLGTWIAVPQHNRHDDNGHTVGVTMTQVTNV